MQPVAIANEPVQTIADIARLAGVSKATVSRALNDSPLIGTDTKERIRAIAREHRFQMNVPARRLSLKQSHVVGLMTYEYRSDIAMPDAFMLEIMSGITSGLHENDYDLLVFHAAPNDIDWPSRYLETGRVDGFILMSATCTKAHLDTLVEAKAPFIVWGLPHATHPFCTVSGDSFAGGKLATEHLLRSGRRRIAFLGGPTKAVEVEDRYRGYETALRETGTTIDQALVAHADWRRPEDMGAAETRELLGRARDLDGVFANSDRLAIGAMDALRVHGRRVPDDVAVVGYDDIALAQHTDPPLTTIRQDGPLAGKLLARHLIEHLQTGVVTNVSIPAELVLRGSA
jgi:DNA-binding LacI/PurR family transcriptional regulator